VTIHQLILALAGMWIAYALGRARMAAERPMGGVSQTWIVTRDNRFVVELKADDGTVARMSLDKEDTRTCALRALEDEKKP
jgi:hypothetical protein